MSAAGAVHLPSLAHLRAFRSSPFICTSIPPVRASLVRPKLWHHASNPTQILRPFSNSSSTLDPQSNFPATADRGPKSTEDTVTDFGTMDVLSSTPAPTTAIDACLSDGFHFDNGLKISGGSGCLLVGGEAFSWRPWEVGGNKRGLLNAKGQWEVAREAWGLLDLVWPKPGECAPKTSLRRFEYHAKDDL